MTRLKTKKISIINNLNGFFAQIIILDKIVEGKIHLGPLHLRIQFMDKSYFF